MPETTGQEIAQPAFLAGGGNMGELIRSINWATTPIGDSATWDDSLKMATSIVLSNPFPMYIAWGPEYTQIYNDGFRPILGSTKHPQAIGRSTRETFAEIWDTIGPLFEQTMRGEPIAFQNYKLVLERNGYLEECYFDFAYSPIKRADGFIAGILVTAIETTITAKAMLQLETTAAEIEKAKSNLIHQQDRLRHFILQAPACICILDGPDFTYELVNASYQALFPGRNLMGKPLLEALPELKGQPIINSLQQVYDTGETFEGNAFLIPLPCARDGVLEDCYFNFIYQARFDAEGNIDGIVVFAFNVTEMVQSKKEIEASAERFRAMVESSPVAMLVTKGGRMIVETINEPMLRLIEKDASVLGKPLATAMPDLGNQLLAERLDQTFRTGLEWSGIEEPLLINKNGMNVIGYYNISYIPLFENDKISGVLHTAVDVSEQVLARNQLKEGTANFRLLADNISQLAWMTDEAGYIFWYNERWYDYTGTDYEEMKGWGWQKVHHPDYVDQVRVKFEEAVTTGKAWEDTFPLRGKDGRYRWFLSTAIPSKDSNGRIIRWFGTNTDITEQRKLMQQKEDFISIASHELKTPLTSIKGYLQMLQSPGPKDDDVFVAEALQRAEQQVNKMSAMIKGFLDLSRFEAGTTQLYSEPFDIGVLIRNIAAETGFITVTHHVVFELCDHVMVLADRDKIGQVITNFLTNAAKYARNGTSITIRCGHSSNQAIVSVHDEGPGIAATHQEKIFERFYRIHGPASGNVSGFGIGLFVCAEIIKQHKGKIWVDSEEGKGSTFCFSLPLLR